METICVNTVGCHSGASSHRFPTSIPPSSTPACPFSAKRMAQKMRNATENWDAPIIVTTNVQFFESLYSNAPRR
jgi:hypothetical protein